MFQFPTFASLDLCIQSRIIVSLLLGFPIQISSDHSSLPAPRGFSQASTSFFASYCQGIHHMRLISWPYNPKSSLLYLVRFSYSSNVTHLTLPMSWLTWFGLARFIWCGSPKLQAEYRSYMRNLKFEFTWVCWISIKLSVLRFYFNQIFKELFYTSRV
jgi:hypothetical protein